MNREVLIPTAGNLSRLWSLIDCITRQTVQPDNIIFLVHSLLQEEQQEVNKYLQKNIQEVPFIVIGADFPWYTPNKWVWYDRKFLLSQASSEYVYMIDDDNVFEDNFLKIL